SAPSTTTCSSATSSSWRDSVTWAPSSAGAFSSSPCPSGSSAALRPSAAPSPCWTDGLGGNYRISATSRRSSGRLPGAAPAPGQGSPRRPRPATPPAGRCRRRTASGSGRRLLLDGEHVVATGLLDGEERVDSAQAHDGVAGGLAVEAHEHLFLEGVGDDGGAPESHQQEGQATHESREDPDHIGLLSVSVCEAHARSAP